MTGVATPNLEAVSLLDTVLGNREGNTVQQPVAHFSQQVAGSPEVAAVLAAAVERVDTQGAGVVERAEQHASRAEAARDASASVALINRGWIADAAALSGISSPVIGDRAMTLNDAHVHRWTGSVWVDEGVSPLSAKGNKIDVDRLLAQAGNPMPAAFLAETVANLRHSLWRSSGALTIGSDYRVTAVVQGVARNAQIYCSSAPLINCHFDLLDGHSRAVSGLAAPSMELIGPDLWRITADFEAAATTAGNIQLCSLSGVTEVFAGNTAKGLRVASFEFRNMTTNALVWSYSGAGDSGFSLANATAISTTTEAATLPVELRAAATLADETRAAVFGRTSMTKLVEAVGAGVTPTVYRLQSPALNDEFEIRVGCRAGERTRLNIFNNSSAIGMNAVFDLGSGDVQLVAGDSAALNHVGLGCYEAVIRKKSTGTTAGNLQLRIYPAAGGQPYAGDGVSGLYIDYVETWKNGIREPRVTDLSAWEKAGMTLTANAGTWLGLLAATGTASSQAMPLQGKKLSLVGTSLVAQGLLTAALAAETGAVIQQLGSSGGALGLDARSSPHYGSGAVTALFGTINSDAVVIVLDMCVNDIAASDVPLGAVGDTTTATYYGALANFFAWCEANRPNAAVCVVVPTAASPAYPVSDYRHGVPNANGDTVEDFQNATRRAALYAGRPCIDPNAYGIGYLDMETGEATSDGLHWDASGAAKIAKIYRKQMMDFCEAGWLMLA